MDKNITENRPNISKIAFWDVDFEKIDFEKSSVSVIEKVFNYGTWKDMLGVLKFYGLKRVKKDSVEISYFKGPALSFLCLILNMEEVDFIAFQQRQKRNSNWIY